jgi:hypothetical protein
LLEQAADGLLGGVLSRRPDGSPSSEQRRPLRT